jgi:cobalamin biosynthetic protein CobC
MAGCIVEEAPFEADLSDLSYHGGNLGAARRLYPRAPEPWIDLSTGVNPHAYPLPRLARERWTRLPDGADLAALEAAAALRYGAAASQTIAAPGSQMIIQLLARLRPARRVGILGFSYGGHGEAWRAAGADVATVDNLGALAAFDVAVVVNPNNPDGRLVEREALVTLHQEMTRAGGMLVVDEAFIDLYAREQSVAPILPPSRTIVLRSFGKVYGLAGLRLGFAIASPDIAAPLRAAFGSWPVSGVAIAIGRAALADDAWLDRMRILLERDAGRLDRMLNKAGCEALGGSPLFRLVRHHDARRLFADLMGRAILARPFAAFPDRLRFGLPAGPDSWRRLGAALRGD